MELPSSFNESPAGFSPIDFRAELNDEQYAAVSAEPGPALVLAGAGSGKTRTLTYRVAWLLTHGVNPWEILLLTFTNKAAHEMLSRVENLTGVAMHKFWGGTFHHIGQRVLRIHGKAIGLEPHFNILDQSDAESLLNATIREDDKNFFKNKDNPKTRVISDIISLARNTLLPIDEIIDNRYNYFEHLADKIRHFNHIYQECKLKQQVVDFDDLLDHWLKLLRQDEVLATQFQERFKHILVDEYQDTNKIQSELIDLLGLNHQIMAVGDDAQCIYTWRGANFENIMTFTDRHPGAVIHKIEINYRSTPEILNLANGILSTQPLGTGYRKELRAVRSSNLIPFVVPVMDGKKQAQFIMKRMEGLFDQGYQLSDMAVLYRAHHHAIDMQIELSRASIPFVITSGVRFFEQAHIKDLVSQLAYVYNPQDSSAFQRFTCLLPRVGEKTASRLHRLVLEQSGEKNISPIQAFSVDEVIKKVPVDAQEDWHDLAYTLQDMAAAVGNRTPKEIVKITIEGWYSSYIRNLYSNWSDRIDDLESLVGFAHRFDDMTELLSQLVLLNSEISDRDVDEDFDALRLTTVHQAKGLEFPIVFIIGLAEGLFPNKRAMDEDNLDEERRLFYVAITRAKDELYLSYPMINEYGSPSMRLNPSRFLDEIDREHYEILRIHETTDW